MSLVETSIRRPVFAWMLMLALIIFGAISFQGMGVSQLPDVDFPVVNVSLTLEGAAPEVMEMDVVDPVESAVMSVEGVESVSSSAKSGSANVTVEFGLNKNIDVAVQEVQTKIAQAQRSLPKNIDPPVVTKSNPEDQPIMYMAVSSEKMSAPELMAYVRDNLQDKFTTLPGVSDVFLGGYVDPNLRVWVSQKKLDKYDLTVTDVIGAIAAEHSEPPAGRIETPKQEFNIRTMGEADSIEEFSKLAINRRGGSPNYTSIALKQVADVTLGLADVRRKSRAMGFPAVGLGIRKQRGSNAVDVADGVKRKAEELKASLPAGMKLALNYDSTKFIKDAVHELNFTLILSAILTAIVCWMFLGSWSATINVILSIPTSIVGTFIVLKAFGFTLNTFTLLGLSLAIGIVVDDAIMVLENIVRHREMGKGRVAAALDGAVEITFAALAATAAVIAIFLPVAFMKGVIGKYFFQFGVTITVAVALSLLEALTLTPMRCSQFLETGERTSKLGRFVEGAFRGAARLYGRILPVLLNHRWKVILGSILIFASSLAINNKLKKEFVPSQDQGTLQVRMKTPDGSSLTLTDNKLRELEAILAKRPEVERYFGAVGGFGGGDVNSAMLFVTLKPKEDRKLSQQALTVELRNQFKEVKGAKVFIQDPSLSGFGAGRQYPVSFTIQGQSFEVLKRSTDKMMAAMEKSSLMTDIDTDLKANTFEYHIVPDRDRARARGVSVADLGATVSAMMGGAIAGRYSKDGRRFDIRVKLIEAESANPEDLNRLQVRNNRGELIPLGDVVKIEKIPGLQAISRQNRSRAVAVYANLAPKASQAVAMAEVERVAKEVLPEGYHIVPDGSSKTFRESFNSLFVALGLGLLVSYMVLASQFNSFIDPVTVLVALPFSISGAFLALMIGGQSLNVYSMIGLILLMGLVKKNSILLVDFTNQVRDGGVPLREALVQACPVRLRPILMTSFATVVGALPGALAIGPGAESRIPMSLAVIGGVLVSTMLTLFVVPCVYSLFARERRKIDLGEDEHDLPQVQSLNLESTRTPGLA